MASAKHKAQYKFRVSYQLDVGSSFDPDMEDIDRWEHELQGGYVQFVARRGLTSIQRIHL